MGRVLLSCSVVFSLVLMACSGGEEDKSTQATSANETTTTTCGDISVDLESVEEIIAAAEEAGADVVEVDDPTDQAELSQDVLKTGIIIAACGSTVITDDSVQDNDTVNTSTTTSKLITAIYQGEIAYLEIRS